MRTTDDAPNIAIFCDYENVALGVRDAHYESFDIGLVLGRLLDKGKIVVKKAYADWERYKSAKRPMHEAAFELIEIPHVSYSGKNSADIRLVVDALDLCYTKSHVDMFVIVSGDSDFSPLVSKLRENDKMVIGMGVKQSSSDLLIDNCDEFIYYDDLVRDKRAQAKAQAKGGGRGAKGRAGKENGKSEPKPEKTDGKGEPAKAAGRRGKESAPAPEAVDPTTAATAASPATPAQVELPVSATQADEAGSKEEALELVLETVEALFRERQDNLWGSMVKQTLKRKRPNFAETFYGYRTFNQLLEEAQQKGLLELQKDDKSGGYLILSFGPNA
jgi:uncharacterized protein (TIGR00288 family)